VFAIVALLRVARINPMTTDSVLPDPLAFERIDQLVSVHNKPAA
jgi:hypothetical protein